MSTAPLDQSRRPRKSRIVVDLDKLEQERPARGRAPRGRGRAGRILLLVALAVVGLLVLSAVAGLVWWRSFQTTPAYSLALLVDAARRDDLRGVEALIDSDQITAGLVPQVSEKLTGGALPEALRARVEPAIQQYLPRVRETMRDEVKNGVGVLAEKTGDVPFPLLALGLRGAAEVKEEGDAATVTIKRGEQPVELTMKRDGGRWKLTGVRDDELTARIAERVRGALPVAGPLPGQQTQQPARRKPKR